MVSSRRVWTNASKAELIYLICVCFFAEIEMSLMEIHRERLSLASSMRDLDGAVSRLDNILMGMVFLICVLILTAMVVSTLIFSSSIPIF